MKIVLVMFRNGQRRDFPLPPGEAVLGRHPACTLQIARPDVSRKHCQITTGNRQVVIEDLKSSNGTFVNGKRITRVALQPGDRIRIGPVVFVAQIDGRPDLIDPEAAVEPGHADGHEPAPAKKPAKPPAAKPAAPPSPAAAASAQKEPDLIDLNESDVDEDELVIDDLLTVLDEDDEEENEEAR